MEDDFDLIKEFVIESTENLSRLDREMVELEQKPGDALLLASIFRTIHTIKGTCGFLAFGVLEKITHQAENILSQVRNGERPLTPFLVSLVLETVDAIKVELNSIEATAHESGAGYEDLIVRLKRAADSMDEGNAAAPAAASPEKPPIEKPAAEPAAQKSVPLEAASAKPETPATATEPEKTGKTPVIAATKSNESAPKPAPEKLAPKAETPSAVEPNTGAAKTSVADSTIRVEVSQLDRLMNLVGELVLTRNQILQFSSYQDDGALNATSQRLDLITSELQENVMKARMQPIGVVWGKFPRVVRDLASACGKQINLELQGAETELDKTIIEAIKDPLTHIVRNACDHGIEKPEARTAAGKPAKGTLQLRAFHESGNVIIEIADDGGGIDPQKIKKSAINKGLLQASAADQLRDSELINFIFLPGFSTAEKVSNISGRGVGMDVVKTNIEKIGGAIDVSSKIGAGTTVKVRIPLTLAIIPGLVITAGCERFVIPQASLVELIRLEGAEGRKQIAWIQDAPLYRRRGQLLPLVYLNQALELGGAETCRDNDVYNIIVLQAGERQFGLVVDKINDTQEIVVKPLSKQLEGVQCYAGATIMGDGKVALILDVLGLAQHVIALSDNQTPRSDQGTAETADTVGQKQALLLFQAGDFARIAVPLSLVARLEEIPRADIERAAERNVLQYRGAILPLVCLAEQLGSVPAAQDGDEPVQLVVFSDGVRQMGLVVDRIIDIVEDTVIVSRRSNHPGLLGSAVIAQKVTDLLDLHAIIQQSDCGWFDKKNIPHRRPTLLLAESCIFSRGVMRSNLESAGFDVIEAVSARDALEKLNKHNVSMAFAALDLPDDGAAKILSAVRNGSPQKSIPLVGLTNDEAPLQRGEDAFDEYLLKFDRASMIESLDRLSASLGAAHNRTLDLQEAHATVK